VITAIVRRIAARYLLPMSNKLLLATLLVVSACASTQTTQMEEIPNRPVAAEAPKPQITPADVYVSKAEPPMFCKQLGGVSLMFAGSDYDRNITELRQQVAEAGGNYLVIDTLSAGRAYSCPKPCTPACSPGFTCVDSACVSACNPACKSGEKCGEDRSCHPIEPVGAGV
jgi:hypothetical protein